MHIRNCSHGPGDVIDRSEPYREHHHRCDARASEITREVDRIMEARDLRTPVADAVSDDFRARYPDMPSHLARGLGATYAAVVEIRDTEAINQVRRENELREGLGSGTRDEHSSQPAVKLRRSLTAPTASPRLRVSWTMSGPGSCPRPSRPRRSLDAFRRRDRAGA